MKKVFMNGEDRDYLLDRLEAILHDNHCPEFIDGICNSLGKYITSNNRVLKLFNLDDAKAGKPVCTRDGRKARIICFDLKNEEYPIVAAIGNDSSETLLCYTINGEITKDNCKSNKDLMMLPEKHEGWINVYKEQCYESKEEAISCRAHNMECIDTIRVEWEE